MPDIIALIVVGVIMLIAFVAWEWYLEVQLDRELEKREQDRATLSFWTPPPLMRVSLWSRARGRFAVMLLIACVEWCSFLSFQFWLTVSAALSKCPVWVGREWLMRNVGFHLFKLFFKKN